MRVFVAGATGALGKELVPRLVADGHDVVGMTRSPEKADLVRTLGAEPAVADALDAAAVAGAVAAAEPEVIVHQLTALSGDLDMRDLEGTFAQTNRLRTEGTDHLLSAARAVAAKRFIAQSFAGWPFAPDSGMITTEADPFDPRPAAPFRSMLAAIRHLETSVRDADWIEGLVLRYGGFYGPGTSLQLHPASEQVTLVRKRRFPIVGSGTGVWSFIHVADAAAATAAAVRKGVARSLQRRRRRAGGGSRVAA